MSVSVASGELSSLATLESSSVVSVASTPPSRSSVTSELASTFESFDESVVVSSEESVEDDTSVVDETSVDERSLDETSVEETSVVDVTSEDEPGSVIALVSAEVSSVVPVVSVSSVVGSPDVTGLTPVLVSSVDSSEVSSVEVSSVVELPASVDASAPASSEENIVSPPSSPQPATNPRPSSNPSAWATTGRDTARRAV